LPYTAARTCLNVPTLQGSYNCGAACASMITNYFKGDTTNREKTAWNNRTTYTSNCALCTGNDWYVCTTYYAVQDLADEEGGDYQHSGDLALGTVKSKVDSETPTPLQAILCDYQGGGHGIVVKGYNTGNDDEDDNILYNDPYDGYGHSRSLAWIEENWDIHGKAYWK